MRGQPVRYIDFRGGLNTLDSDYLVGENECRDCRNVVSSTRGSIRKRDGHTTFSSSFTGSPTSMLSLYPVEIAGVITLLATAGTKIHTISSVGVNADITAALTLTAGTRWDFAQAPAAASQGPVYAVNGTDAPIQWTGSGNAAAWTKSGSGEPPIGGSSSDRPQFIAAWENRVYLARSANNRSRIWWSDVGNPNVWPTANVTDLDPNDGEEITGMGRVGPYLLVFKRTKTFLIYDSDTSANRVLSGSVGCIANRSIVETPMGTMWLSLGEGIVVTNGQTVKTISKKIQPTLDAAVLAGSAANAAAAWFNSHYYLAFSSGGGGNDLLFDFDSQLDSWWLHSTALNDLAVVPAPSASALYGAEVNAGRVSKLFVPDATQDNGATFPAYWLGPWLSFGEPYRLKRVREVNFDGSGFVTVGVGRDFGEAQDFASFRFVQDTGTFGGDGTFGGSGYFGGSGASTQRASIFTPGVARSWSLKLTTRQDDQTEIDSITWLIQKRTD